VFRIDGSAERMQSAGAGADNGDKIMKSYLLAVAALVALPQAAEAVCSKSSLKGTWGAGFGGAALISVNTNGRMPVYLPVFPLGGILKINTFNGSCRGSGMVTGSSAGQQR
jgi:hypothetical protein